MVVVGVVDGELCVCVVVGVGCDGELLCFVV